MRNFGITFMVLGWGVLIVYCFFFRLPGDYDYIIGGGLNCAGLFGFGFISTVTQATTKI